MASEPTIDIDDLLQPISEENPCGVALKEDASLSTLYYEAKDAREEARAAERSALSAAWSDENDPDYGKTERADWDKVVNLTQQILRENSKDLWIAAWLLEGLTRRHGFAGLRDGFQLIRELCDKYWGGVHPRPDEDGVATTVAQLTGLNGDDAEGALIAPIAGIEITEGVSVGPLTGSDYNDAVGLAGISDPETRAKRVAQGVVTIDKFETAARETSQEFFTNLREDIQAAISEFALLTNTLSEVCGESSDGYSAAPPSSNIRQALDDSLESINTIAGEPIAEAEEVDEEQSVNGALVSGGAPAAPTAIGTREDAFLALTKVADFFRRAEPHSPVSYALEQAVRWGRMSLPELMKELISDDSTRRELHKRTGIPMMNEDDD